MKFLLIRNDVLGDAIVSSTFIESLYKSVSCEIDMLCHGSNEIAFRYNPYLSHIFISQHQQGTKKLAVDHYAIIAEINTLNPDGYDAVFVLNPCLRNLKYANQIHAKYIFARKFSSKSFSTKLWLLAHQMSSKLALIQDKTCQHEAESLHDLLHYGLKICDVESISPLSLQSRFYLSENISKIAHEGVVINISGKSNPIKYLNDNMLLSLLIKIPLILVNQKISVICLEDDLQRVRNVIANLNGKINIEIATTVDLWQIAEIISQHTYFIGGDGGLAHLAAGLGLYCLTLFDQQSKIAWHPWTTKQISLQASSHSIYDISYIDVILALQRLRNIKYSVEGK